MADRADFDWLRRTLDALPCAVSIARASGPSFPLVFVNGAFERLTGYSATDAQGCDFSFLAATTPDQPGLNRFRDALTEGEAVRRELLCLRKDGTPFWDEISAALLCDEHGQSAPYWMLTHTDVSGQKLAREELTAERDRLLGFIEHVPLGMLALDWVINGVFIIDATRPDMPIIYVNAAFERLTGFLGEEALGRDCCFFIDPNESVALVEVRLAFTERRETKLELRSRRKDGSRFWNELTLSPVFDVSSQLTHYLGIQTDISDRKKAEGLLQELSAELRQSRDNMMSILNEFPSGTRIIEADGTLSFASKTCQTILGIDPASVLGQPWRRVFPIDVDSARQFQRTLEAKTKLREPLCIHWQDADQGTHWVECVVKDDPRDSARRLVFLDDVTELRSLRDKLEAKRYGGLVGESEAMENLNRMIVQIGRGDWTVLIEGETGVGKELVARGIHEASPRKAGPYVAINAAGLSESLLSSQLFGHRKGAFTGATADQQGFFEAANGGTLFLDEIGDLPLAMQAALLRVLQEREIIRLGETQARKSDVRIIAATHKDLIAEVAAGRFREDLFFRLRVARIHIPSLRERKTDIPLLVEHFLRSASQQIGKPVNSLQADALQRLLAYDWPGNVRELRSCVDFALIHCLGDSIQVNDLPPEIRNQRLGDLPNTGLGLALIDDERQRILQALKTAGGNRTKAVQLLGISRATFYRRLQELGIEI